MALLTSLVFGISFMSGVFYSEAGTFAPTYAPAPSPAAVSPVPAIASNNTYTTEQTDVDAMQNISTHWKQSNSDLYRMLPGWSTADPCFGVPWQGILCSFEFAPNSNTSLIAKVIGITLTNLDIIGTLPPAIGDLYNLVLLTVADNPGLSGPIPKEVGRISLTILDLHNNNLTGIIPPELGTPLTLLEQIDLSDNSLVGPIPPELENTTLLQVLPLSHNQLNGTIPAFLGNLPYLTTLNLFNNSFSGPLPDFRNMTSLTSLNVSQNQLSGKVTLDEVFNMTANINISSLDISSNHFTGPIPNLTRLSTSLRQLDLSNNPFDTSTTVPFWLQSLENLRSLRLSNISLSGDLPSFLLYKDTIKNLETLTLDRNSISGENIDLSNINPNLKLVNLTSNNIKSVSNSKRLVSDFVSSGSRSVDFLLHDTPYCKANDKNVDVTNDATFFCSNRPPVLDNGFTQDRKNRYHKVVVLCSVTAAILAAFLIAPFVFLFWKTRREKRRLLLQIQKEFAKNDVQPTLYTYSELRAATNEFHSDMKLGEGGFGIVYKGVQPDGTELAVKQLSSRSQQGIDEFLNEVVLITGVRHRNLVKLKGCCIRDDVRRLLVYEYIENNNLAEVLFDGIGEQDLNWGVRYNMCIGVAQGLHYLHEIAQPRIIHRDIKAPNILLDKHMNAKIADFGLARLFPDEESHISTLHIAGTMGYMAPEYASQGQLTEKADVFSFGVLVLEILSGRRNIEPKLSTEEVYLIEWAWKLHEEGRALDVVDPTMSIRGHEEDVARVVNVALLCVQPTGARRPSMARVVSVLKGEMDTEVVIRETRYDKLDRAAFLATAQSGSDLTLVTNGKSVERKPLLDRGSTSGTSDRSRSSGFIELSDLTPR